MRIVAKVNTSDVVKHPSQRSPVVPPECKVSIPVSHAAISQRNAIYRQSLPHPRSVSVNWVAMHLTHQGLLLARRGSHGGCVDGIAPALRLVGIAGLLQFNAVLLLAVVTRGRCIIGRRLPRLVIGVVGVLRGAAVISSIASTGTVVIHVAVRTRPRYPPCSTERLSTATPTSAGADEAKGKACVSEGLFEDGW